MNKSLEELAVITYGKDYKLNPSGESVPIYGTGGLMGYTSLKLNSGPAVLTGRKGSINKPFYLEGNFWHVDTIFCIKAKQEVNTKWLFYNLKNTDLNKLNEATGVPSVNTQSLYKLMFKYFNPSKQRKIAQILTTCDTVIEKTEASIAKYQAIKQGLLHDLFTRGINIETGKLRPKYEDAPDLYEESKLGWIPKEWDVNRLEELCSEKPKYGINAAAVEFNNNLPLYLRITDIDENGNFSKIGRKSVDNPFSDQYYLKKGDIVFARTGATVGKTYLYKENDGALIYAGFLIKVSPNNNILNSNFLKFLTETDYYLNWVVLMSQRSGQPGINGAEYGSLMVPTPSIKEQEIISQRLLVSLNKIQTEQSALSKYQLLKTGLMQDLLSGKVEVKI